MTSKWTGGTPGGSPLLSPQGQRKIGWRRPSGSHTDATTDSPLRLVPRPLTKAVAPSKLPTIGADTDTQSSTTGADAPRKVSRNKALLAYCDAPGTRGISSSTKISTKSDARSQLTSFSLSPRRHAETVLRKKIQVIAGSPIATGFKVQESGSNLGNRSLQVVRRDMSALNNSQNQSPTSKSNMKIRDLNQQFKLKVEKQIELSQASESLRLEGTPPLTQSMFNPKTTTPSNNRYFIVKKQQPQQQQTSTKPDPKVEVNQQLISKQSEMNPFTISRTAQGGFGKIADHVPKITYRHDILSMTGYNPDKEKSNQDYARYHLFTMRSGQLVRLYALADGHGTHGGQASRLAVDTLVGLVESKLLNQQSDDQTNESTIKHIVEECFEATHNCMKSDREKKFKYSGTTMVLVVVHNNVIYFCNAGDSRAILGSLAGDWQNPDLTCTYETQLHKPELPEEEDRIKSFGGLVSPYLDEETGEFLGPHRVWNSLRREPGLATSRTLGDVLAHSLGVTYRPGSRLSQQRSTSGK